MAVTFYVTSNSSILQKFVRPLRFWLALPPALAGGSHPHGTDPIRYHVTLAVRQPGRRPMGQMGHGHRVSVNAFDGSNGSWASRSESVMGQMGHGPSSRKPCSNGQNRRADGSNGSMGHDIFFRANVCAGVPSGYSRYRFTYKTNKSSNEIERYMTHLTHFPLKIGADAMTPTRPTATHRAMGHADRLHCHKLCGKMLSMRSTSERATWGLTC